MKLCDDAGCVEGSVCDVRIPGGERGACEGMMSRCCLWRLQLFLRMPSTVRPRGAQYDGGRSAEIDTFRAGLLV